MTTPHHRSDHRGAAVLLTVLVVVCWIATVALPLVASTLLRGVDAPADRSVTIVIAWFLTPFLAAVGATVGLVALQRSRRAVRRQAAPE
ncbi:hypothetical protein ACRQ4B_02100 [Curtobacterium sp. SP.BCo]|uniref:hypothetical protein n=1 Tax=Curtobacterium sp. SP.BCo TaxID=3435229 RepID=UPI003F7383C1